jgi:hypothetical protein
MAATDRLRIEIAFEGPQALSVLVTGETAEELDRALGDGGDGAFTFDADDGRYTVLLRRVVYVKRFARESRVGFGTNA